MRYGVLALYWLVIPWLVSEYEWSIIFDLTRNLSTAASHTSRYVFSGLHVQTVKISLNEKQIN